MIGGGGYVLNAEKSAEGRPYCGCELWTSVAGNRRWQPETLYPSREEGGCAVGGGGGGDWHSFRPSRGSVYDRKQERITAGFWQRPDQVDVQM